MAYTKVIVTGGSSGLGLALATHYASSGAEVALVARNAHKLAAAAQQIQQQTGRAVKIASVDVCDEQAALQAMEPWQLPWPPPTKYSGPPGRHRNRCCR